VLAPIPNSFCVNYVPYSFLTPRHRQTTDERWLIFLIGLSPPPGTPEAALSLRKYHCDRHLSSLFSEAIREFPQRAQLLRKGAVPWECRLSLSPDNNGNVSVAGIFIFSRITRVVNLSSHLIFHTFFIFERINLEKRF
jgi:hypothetical protein